MRLFFVSLLLSLSYPSTLAQPPQGSAGLGSRDSRACKAVPGDRNWPSDSEWAVLNATVRGRLLKPAPPAAVCHPNWPEYDSDACKAVKKGWRDSDWHAADPTSNMWQNWNNYSCMPDPSGPCSTTGYPIFVVAVKNAYDVKAAVDFARTRNVRLNIKSTGHDFLGRSVQPNSLSIWTRSLKHIKWYNSSFTPEGCNFVINGPTVSVGSGSQWGEVYNSAYATEAGLGVVGGAYGSVSVGGYLSNGGHGYLSAKYGLGADMVLQIELVTAGGDIIVANECQNQDYFWAMRGGGGSTYGVALSFTLQAVRYGKSVGYNGKVVGWDQLAYLHSQWPSIAAAGGGGYISGYPALGGNISFSVSLPNATSAELKAIVDPIIGRMKRRFTKPDTTNETVVGNGNTSPKPIITGRYRDYDTLADAQNDAYSMLQEGSTSTTAGGFPGMGTNKILASWLWSAQDVSHAHLEQALIAAFDKETYLLNDATMGIGTQNPPFIRGGGNAVNPAFRTAVMRPAAELQWEGIDQRKLKERKEAALRFGAALKSVNPAGGTYANEADPEFPDWQHAFWGSNYERLFAIKRRVDPWGVFYCRSCVGSELFEDINGVLCRR